MLLVQNQFYSAHYSLPLELEVVIPTTWNYMLGFPHGSSGRPQAHLNSYQNNWPCMSHLGWTFLKGLFLFGIGIYIYKVNNIWKKIAAGWLICLGQETWIFFCSHGSQIGESITNIKEPSPHLLLHEAKFSIAVGRVSRVPICKKQPTRRLHYCRVFIVAKFYSEARL